MSLIKQQNPEITLYNNVQELNTNLRSENSFTTNNYNIFDALLYVVSITVMAKILAGLCSYKI